jgi:hypothetical protein
VLIPSEGLSASLIEADGLPDGVSFYSGPTNQVVPPAIVIRPDEPWITQDPSTFCHDTQNYVAVLVVSASSPVDGIGTIYEMALAVVAALPEGWSWSTVGIPVIDESTGTAFLAAPLRLQYRNEAAA